MSEKRKPLLEYLWHNAVCIRAGPQNEKWSDRQKTENPTGSIHQEARKKKSLTQKKFILMRGFAFEKYGPCSKNAQRKLGKNIKTLPEAQRTQGIASKT